jgi:hypothetical protein
MPKLKQQFAINHRGETIALNQWQVWDEDVLIGYLPHQVDSVLSVIAILPDNYFSEPVLTDLAKQRKDMDGKDSKVLLSETFEVEQKAAHLVLDELEREELDGDDE